jgi:hypothetical protein
MRRPSALPGTAQCAGTSAHATGGDTELPTQDTCTDLENKRQTDPKPDSHEHRRGRNPVGRPLPRRQHPHGDIDDDEGSARDLDRDELAIVPKARVPA